jgi:hypothetical protein
MSDTDLFDASSHNGIAAGSCVMIEDAAIIYAGPLEACPEATGKLILLHPNDFLRLKNHVQEARH